MQQRGPSSELTMLCKKSRYTAAMPGVWIRTEHLSYSYNFIQFLTLDSRLQTQANHTDEALTFMDSVSSTVVPDPETTLGEEETQDGQVDLASLERLAADIFLRVNELERTMLHGVRVDQTVSASLETSLLARIRELESQVEVLTRENERLNYRVKHLVRNLEALRESAGKRPNDSPHASLGEGETL
jgi:hypothetical protein